MGVGGDSFIKCKQYSPETLILAKAASNKEISFSLKYVSPGIDR